MIQECETKMPEDCRFEAHKKSADIPYMEDKDVMFFENANAHRPCLRADPSKADHVKKAVVKILLED